MSGWPDPSRPGVPLNPERDLWHWVVWRNLDEATPWQWFAGGDGQPPCWSRSARAHSVETMAASFRYIGPCLTPVEVAAEVRAAVENERAKERDRTLAVLSTEPIYHLTARQIMDRIRATQDKEGTKE